MLAAGQLYHQIAFKAPKINDLRSDGMLASELVSTRLAAAEFCPKCCFGLGWIISELSGFGNL